MSWAPDTHQSLISHPGMPGRYISSTFGQMERRTYFLQGNCELQPKQVDTPRRSPHTSRYTTEIDLGRGLDAANYSTIHPATHAKYRTGKDVRKKISNLKQVIFALLNEIECRNWRLYKLKEHFYKM